MSEVDEFLPQRGEIASLIRSRNWCDTPLGPMGNWPSSLKTVLRLMLTSRYAMWLGWGDDLLFFYNDAYREQTLGAKHPASLGRPFRQVWAEIWEDLAPRIRRVVSTGEATWDSGLLLFLQRNGYSEETYHTFSYSPAPADTGGVGGLFCVVIEETERVLAERRAALLRELATALGPTKTTSAVLSAMEDCLSKDARDIPFSLTYLFDEDGHNARLVARTGIAADHPGAPPVVATAAAGAWDLGAVWSSLRPLDVALAGNQPWPQGPWRSSPTQAWIVPIAQAGQARPAGAFVAALNPHRAFDENYRSFVELFVGQLSAGLANARAYETEKKQAEALAQLDRAKTAFFSNVSHEFRTPLTLMLGPTEDALQSEDRALRGDALEIVHRNELRLLKLVNALLDFSRMEAGRVQASYVPTDLAQLTADLASAFQSAMERGGLRYEVDCPSLPGTFYVDRDMWEKIVLNLLSNALKFTLNGFVRVRLRQVGGHAELVVRDSGPGVSPSELPHMFERFHRIEGTPARTHEGSGIGLALVRDLVELHGGTIRIESELGKGTAFIVAIPEGAAHLPSEHVQLPPAGARPGAARATTYVAEALRWVPSSPDEADQANPPADRDGTRSPGARILVADDNADMREYIARLLRTHWSVEAVSDGKAALDRALQRPPDLVLSDVMMPHMDGFELVRRLREEPSTRIVPVVLLSARAGEEATGEGLRAGANDYIVKPFSARELVARVSSQLAIAAVRKQAEAEKEAQRRVVESLFTSAPAGIALLRGDRMTIEFANTMALEIWGKTSDVVGRPLLEALPEIRGQGLDDLIRAVIRTGSPFLGEEVPVTLQRGGRRETLFLKFVYAPAPNEAGVVDGVAAFGFDVTPQVTARKHAMLAAIVGRAFVSNERLGTQLTRCCEALVDNGAVHAQIWTFNSGQQVLELQASAGSTPPNGAPGRREPLAGAGVGLIARATSPQLGAEVSASLADPDWVRGERVTAFVGYPLRLGDRLVGALVIFSREELSTSTREALGGVSHQIALGIDRDLSERFRDLFIGMLGHDLRNPLNAVNVAAHVLEDVGALTPTQTKAVLRIRNSASRMTRMITQVLDFTRVRAGGGIPLDRKASDLKAICAHAIDELAVSNPERAIDAVYVGDTAGLWDADRLAQVFSNLVGNALTHGRPDAPVRVVVDGSAPAVLCSVHNLGRPIPAAMLSTLFDPFRRAVHGKSAGTAGLGLGLFIAQHIIRAHGGHIEVQSSEVDGTRFTFQLDRASGQSA
jgi:signal transduction histidine kinase/CheY-like chemotaxis protein